MVRQLAKINGINTTYESMVYTIVHDDTRYYNPYIVYRTERSREDGWKTHREKVTAFADYKSCVRLVAEYLGVINR